VYWRADEGAFEALQRQLEEYFAGRRTTWDLELRPSGTPFQLAVWSALRDIPYGATVGYGELAAHIGRPSAARAVGAANGANPISIVIPCHRVIGADGSLTGYGWGVEQKAWLLAHERAR
jgi:methylated-DNA-[protein]-cysteine S-methyltransferase